jgi:hypothetical protein
MQWMCTVLHTSCTTQRWQVVSTQHTSTPSSKPCNTVKIDGNQYARWHHTCMHGVSSRAHAYPHVHALATFTMCGINNVRERSVLTKTANVLSMHSTTRHQHTTALLYLSTCDRSHRSDQAPRSMPWSQDATSTQARAVGMHACTHALCCTICVLAHAWLDHPIQTGQCRADNADADGCTDMNNERGETTRSLSLAGLSTAVPRKIRPTHANKASGEFGNPCMAPLHHGCPLIETPEHSPMQGTVQCVGTSQRTQGRVSHALWFSCLGDPRKEGCCRDDVVQ